MDPNLVKAQVVDIRDRKAKYPQRVVLDANVLYFVYYPNFAFLAQAGGKPPRGYQRNYYPAWIKQAMKANVQLCASFVTVAEFVSLVEYGELETIWLFDPGTPAHSQFSPVQKKSVRYQYVSQLPRIRQSINTVIASVRKEVELVPHLPAGDAGLSLALGVWNQSVTDFPDAVCIANGQHEQVVDVLSDDADFATVDGIILYTACETAVRAAQQAGKLVT